jgi:hypothetical protein
MGCNISQALPSQGIANLFSKLIQQDPEFTLFTGLPEINVKPKKV